MLSNRTCLRKNSSCYIVVVWGAWYIRGAPQQPAAAAFNTVAVNSCSFYEIQNIDEHKKTAPCYSFKSRVFGVESA